MTINKVYDPSPISLGDIRTKDDIYYYYTYKKTHTYLEDETVELFKTVAQVSTLSLLVKAILADDLRAFLLFKKIYKEFGKEIDQNSLFAAVLTGQTKWFSHLTELDWDYSVDNNGQTPVYLATLSNKVDVLCLLIKEGCNLEYKDSSGHGTLVHIATDYGHELCLSALIDAGCPFDRADNSDANGYRPAHLAALKGHDLCLRNLECAGCDLNQTDNNGRTPAFFATVYINDESVYSRLDCLRVLESWM